MSRVEQIILDNPQHFYNEIPKPIPNAYVLDTSKPWQRWLFKALKRIGFVKGMALYMDRTKQVSYQRVSFNAEDFHKHLYKHMDRINALMLNDKGIDRIIMGRDAFYEVLNYTLHSPMAWMMEWVVTTATGATAMDKRMHRVEHYLGIKVQYIPWFEGVVVVPKED